MPNIAAGEIDFISTPKEQPPRKLSGKWIADGWHSGKQVCLDFLSRSHRRG